MVSTWIESAARGRHGGPVRAGMWSSVVVGTHPIEADQEVWLEVAVDDVPVGPLPAYWIENKGVNSLWHVPLPPQAVGVRLHYRAGARRDGSVPVFSPTQHTMVRPNLPSRTETGEVVAGNPEGLVGNRMMTARVDARGSTYDVYFPTVGLHSDVRPAEGELPQSRSHFRAIVGGLAVGRRLDWFSEREDWQVFQHYQGATNILTTELTWRRGSIRVLATDFVATGVCLPRTAGGTESPGQYVKRYRIFNESPELRHAMFGVYLHAEVNGGVGDPGLSWRDDDAALLVTNRGHGHANRKLARDATVEFAIALDGNGPVDCEPTGPNEAILLRRLELPAEGSVAVDLLVSGAFTGWRGDPGTYEHWLKPALDWFRSADLDAVEQCSAQEWDSYVEPLPGPYFPKPNYAVSLRRSALAASLHCDAHWGAIAAGFERGLNAYCWPRDAVWAANALGRLGHNDLARNALRWLARVRGQNRSYAYWYQKYTIDGWPEWENPAVDQSAIIPVGLEAYYRRTADLDFVSTCWPMIEQAAAVCGGASAHPGLRMVGPLSLISSAGIWDSRFGAFFYSNACVVAGLRASARLAREIGRDEAAAAWDALADKIWGVGILGEAGSDGETAPGLIDPASGRFLDARRLSKLHGLWTDQPEMILDSSAGTDVSQLGAVVPFGLLPASDPRMRRTAEAILRHNAQSGDPNVLTRWSFDPARPDRALAPGEALNPGHDGSSLATLWMARYLIRLGRETGQLAHWNRALAMLDTILNRLGALGLSLRPAARGGESSRFGFGESGVWGLHGMLVETMLDLAGLDFDAVARTLHLEPALPSSWPHIGLDQQFTCGKASYRLERPIGGNLYRLSFAANLVHPVTLSVRVTCPGLHELGPWKSRPGTPQPRLDPTTGRSQWDVELPAGKSDWSWTWG